MWIIRLYPILGSPCLLFSLTACYPWVCQDFFVNSFQGIPPRGAFLTQMVANSLREQDGELKQHLAPILDTSCPFSGDIHRRQVEHFEQCFIGRENALALRHLAKLPVVAFNHVRCIDELADLQAGT